MRMFKECETPIYTNIDTVVKHVYSRQDCYYHRIIMRIIQGTYSPLIFKLQIKDDQNYETSKLFSVLHNKKVTLPPYIESSYQYQSYRFEK